jgi:16S rRNA (cytosine1402-N4)-methyltransferase
MDRDSDALAISRKRLADVQMRTEIFQTNYSKIDKILDRLGLHEVQGILLDLGMSSLQLEQSGRGFSFNRDEPLDMRMDSEDSITADRLVNECRPKELEHILRKYGEERKARAIVTRIVQEREKAPIRSSASLAELVRSVFPESRHARAKDPATRTFQALRIAVNRELVHLKRFLEKAPSIIGIGGRLVIIAYHSLEDRMVKQAMSAWEKPCICPSDLPECGCGKKPLFKRVIKKGKRPDLQEISRNPRARSAILRVAERI